jgi:hypothetical protein
MWAQRSYLEDYGTVNFGLNVSRMDMSNAYFTRKGIPNKGTLFSGSSVYLTDVKYADHFTAVYPSLSLEHYGENEKTRGMFFADLSGMSQFCMLALYKVFTRKTMVTSRLKEFKNNFDPKFSSNNSGSIDVDVIAMRFAKGLKINRNNDKSLAIEPGVQFNIGGHQAIIYDEGAMNVHLSKPGELGYGFALHFIKPTEKYMIRVSILYNKIKPWKNDGFYGKELIGELCIYVDKIFAVNIFCNYLKTIDQTDKLYYGVPYSKLEGGTFKTIGTRIGYNF